MYQFLEAQTATQQTDRRQCSQGRSEEAYSAQESAHQDIHEA